MMERGFRKYGRRDVFELARKDMEFRLIQIEDDILRRFRSGEQRETMRRTMGDLLGLETTIQGKIQKLMRIAEQIEVTHFQEETEDCSNASQMSFFGREGREISNRRAINHSTQYSRLANAKDLSMTEKNYSNLTQNNQSQSHKSQNSSFRPYPNIDYNQNESSIERQQQRQSSHPSPNLQSRHVSKGSLVSLTDKEDVIDEQDIFSFRTQEAPSPIRRSLNINNRDSAGSNENQEFYQKEKDRSISRSKSKSKSSNNSRSKLTGKMRSNKSFKKIDYDGESFVYEGSLFSSKVQKESSISKKSIVRLPEKTRGKLYDRISRRIQLSRCVVDVINHSNPSVDSAYFINRFKHELSSRNELTKQIQAFLTNSGIWRC